jgi:flagellar motor switch protein FliM
MKRIILATLATVALLGSATLPATALNSRFSTEREQTLNKLNDRFSKEHQQTLDKLNDRFDKSFKNNLNR